VLRRRQIAQKRRWTVARGATSARFGRSVQNAYGYTCVVCGLKLPPAGDRGRWVPISRFEWKVKCWRRARQPAHRKARHGWDLITGLQTRTSEMKLEFHQRRTGE
jgi:hypothetical protein